MFSDAGIAEPYKLRTELLHDPARHAQHERAIARTMSFLVKSNIVSNGRVLTDEHARGRPRRARLIHELPHLALMASRLPACREIARQAFERLALSEHNTRGPGR